MAYTNRNAATPQQIAESERKAVTEREGFGEYDAGYLGSGVSGAQRSAATGRLFINLDNVLYPELVKNKTRSVEQIGKYSGYGQFTKLTGSIGKAGLERAAAHLNISPQEAARRAQAQGTTLGPDAASAYGLSPTKVANVTATYESKIKELQDMITQQTADFAAQMQQGLAAQQEAYNRQAQQMANSQRAYTPAPEATATETTTTDSRLRSRDTAQSRLSSLAIIEGLGTSSNPLSGFQLA